MFCVSATLLTFVLIIAISVFMYGTFYYAYMPLEVSACCAFLYVFFSLLLLLMLLLLLLLQL